MLTMPVCAQTGADNANSSLASFILEPSLIDTRKRPLTGIIHKDDSERLNVALQEARSRNRVEAIRLDLPEPHGFVQPVSRPHLRQRIQTHPPVAHRASLR